ncbi:MAG: replication initiator protein [Pseudonocardiales bacterium]|nr:replication initiator protein [Pseudonocardiales bacterium]MBV9651175.1 replication initiator protein [Pseudonocardiales bacterium]
MTRAQRAALPLSADVVHALAERHGVCTRPLAMRRIDTTTGRVDIVPVPCGSTREDQCRPCADKARRLRMVQCREGWHLDHEPVIDRATPSDNHQELMAARADLLAAYTECKTHGDELTCEQIADSIAELDTALRAAGVRGRLTPVDPPSKPLKRSTRRRQDAPDLPRRPAEKRTVGRVFAGRYRPSTFLTLTLDSYGRVDTNGAPLDPDHYDYRRAARDAIHFPALLDRFWQNTRRCVGWDVQYFGTVEPQKRGAPHFHAAIRGAIARTELRAITAATYQQVWWPPHNHIIYGDDRMPVWNARTKAFTDPDTGAPLLTWDQACEQLTEPAHIVRFGSQIHVKGILGGTEEAGRHIGYLTKYLTKSIDQAAGLGEHATDAQRDHAHRLHAELRVTPCSPRCPVWLLYGIQPKGARHSMTPRRCKGKAHQLEHLGIVGRRVLVSRKWSNKTLDDHRAERAEFVHQLLQQIGVQPSHGPQDGPFQWERPAPTDPDIPPRPVLLLHAIAERQRWKAEYTAAQLATSNAPPDNRSLMEEAA